MYKKNFAFSLSEIITVIVVAGVIAFITLPDLIKRHSNIANVTRLIKTYTLLEKVNTFAFLEHGSITGWNFKDRNQNDLLRITSYYEPYLNFFKKCHKEKDCWCDKTYNLLHNETDILQADKFGDGQVISYKMKDGSFLAFDVYSKYYFNFINNNLAKSNNTYLVIAVDVNGNKKPNMFGRDIFVFSIDKNNEIIPAGQNGNSPLCTTKKNDSKAGFDCTYKVLKERAINY